MRKKDSWDRSSERSDSCQEMAKSYDAFFYDDDDFVNDNDYPTMSFKLLVDLLEIDNHV